MDKEAMFAVVILIGIPVLMLLKGVGYLLYNAIEKITHKDCGSEEDCNTKEPSGAVRYGWGD